MWHFFYYLCIFIYHLTCKGYVLYLLIQLYSLYVKGVALCKIALKIGDVLSLCCRFAEFMFFYQVLPRGRALPHCLTTPLQHWGIYFIADMAFCSTMQDANQLLILREGSGSCISVTLLIVCCYVCVCNLGKGYVYIYINLQVLWLGCVLDMHLQSITGYSASILHRMLVSTYH